MAIDAVQEKVAHGRGRGSGYKILVYIYYYKNQSVRVSQYRDQDSRLDLESNPEEMEAQSTSKTAVVSSLNAAKRNSGKTYGQIAAETGLTNVYVAQLFKRQAQLSPETAPKLRSALPQLPEELLQEMMQPPCRSYDPNLIQDPTVYR